jgi:26S proteasome regulatory subunit N1
MDIQQKPAYDSDTDLACKAILAMGLIAVGTNYTRLADLFGKLADYYYKEPQLLLCIRLAQDFLYMGKIISLLVRVCSQSTHITIRNS